MMLRFILYYQASERTWSYQFYTGTRLNNSGKRLVLPIKLSVPLLCRSIYDFRFTIPNISLGKWKSSQREYFFLSLKISLETLESSFHRGEKTEISREASWDIWNSPLSYEPNQSQKRWNVYCDWFILPLLLSTPTIWFSLDRERSQKKMETFWFFWLRFRLAYDSAYDSYFWYSLSHKRSCHSSFDSDSGAWENHPLGALINGGACIRGGLISEKKERLKTS